MDSVVEVIDQSDGRLDPNRSDISRGIVTALFFRNTWIPVVDPALRLDLTSAAKIQDRAIIVLRGPEGNWGLLVDEVVELSKQAELVSCEIPFLLRISAHDSYSELMLLHNEPVVVFEPELYYGSIPVAV